MRSRTAVRRLVRTAVNAAVAPIALAVVLAACGSSRSAEPTTTTTSFSTTVPSTTTPGSASTTTIATPTTTTLVPSARYEPLFPFANLQDADTWQRESGSKGLQPWRFDAGQTALAFASFLGYTEVDRVLSVTNDARGAHVAIGFTTEGTSTATAAIVHLIRYGSGQPAPWEVVGTDDTNFTLDTPRYGTGITSPIRVGGRITGVDESITVHAQQLHANGYLGERCCLPAGGQDVSWDTTLTFNRPTDPVVIISASTGGHLQKVERFAVTGVTYG